MYELSCARINIDGYNSPNYKLYSDKLWSILTCTHNGTNGTDDWATPTFRLWRDNTINNSIAWTCGCIIVFEGNCLSFDFNWSATNADIWSNKCIYWFIEKAINCTNYLNLLRPNVPYWRIYTRFITTQHIIFHMATVSFKIVIIITFLLTQCSIFLFLVKNTGLLNYLKK